MKRNLFFAILMLAAVSASAVTTNRILVVGNSYSSTIFDENYREFHHLFMLRDLINSSSNHYAVIDGSILGGKGFQYHWEQSDLSQQGASISNYTLLDWGNGSTTNRILGLEAAVPADRQGNYDWVFMQDHSQTAGLTNDLRVTNYTISDRPRFDEFSSKFHALITNQGAQVCFYTTWAKTDFEETAEILLPDSAFDLVAGEGLRSQASYDQMYWDKAAELGCKAAPMGRAVKRSIEEFPTMDDKIEQMRLFYDDDGSHPATFARYMAVCTFYAAVYEESPEGLPYVPPGYVPAGVNGANDIRPITTNECRRLQRVAWDTYQRYFVWSNPPTVTVTASVYRVGHTNAAIHFTAYASDDSAITDYEWSFSDGTVTNGASLTNVTHVFTNAGTYDVWCRVTDSSNETDRAGKFITVDDIKPVLDEVQVPAALSVKLLFNEDMDPVTGTNLAHFSIDHGVVIDQALVAGSSISLNLQSPLQTGVTYSVTVTNVQDFYGNTMDATNQTFVYEVVYFDDIVFDFGSASYVTTGHFNNVTSAGVGLKVTDALTTSGRTTRIDLSITNDFAGIKTAGYLDDSVYPVSAQRDSFYLDGGHLSGSNDNAWLLIEDLNPFKSYNFSFYASATNASYQQAFYKIGSQSVSIDAAGKSNETAVIYDVMPDALGNVSIEIYAPEATDYGHLSALKIQETPPTVYSDLPLVADTYVDPNNSGDFSGNDYVRVQYNSDTNVQERFLCRFDASGMTELPVEASFWLAFHENSNTRDDPITLAVYGLNDGDADESWNESTVNWQTCPADAGGAGNLLDTNRATKLGSFSRLWTTNDFGTQFQMTDLTSTSLVSFLRQDTDGQVTLLVIGETDTGSTLSFASDEHDWFLGPALRVEYFKGTNIVTTTSSLSVPEGSTNSFGVRLGAQPDQSVTVSVVRVSGDSDISVSSGSSLVFTTNNWSTDQFVVLSAAEDDDWFNSNAVIRCTAPRAPVADVTATEADNEENPAYLLPFTETFETNPVTMAGTPGAVDGQHGWSGDGSVQSTTARDAQALALSDGRALHTFLGSPTNIWISFYLYGNPFESAPSRIDADSTAVLFVNTNGHLVAYSNTTPVELSASVSNGWNKIEIAADYVSKVWNLSLNGIEAASGFGFYSDQSAFNALQFTEMSTNAAYVDDVHISDTADTSDTDSDTLPDAWEESYFGGLEVSPDDPASNSAYTVQQCYIAGLDPTDPQAEFRLSTIESSFSSSVLQWQNTSGRVYSVWWTSNLFSGFQLLESNFTGGAFTDSVHDANDKGFYKIDVRVE
jgi:hypothetical protein